MFRYIFFLEWMILDLSLVVHLIARSVESHCVDVHVLRKYSLVVTGLMKQLSMTIY